MGNLETNSQSKLHSMLDKDVSIPAYYGVKTLFFTNGKINAKGRVYLKIFTVLISLIYFLGSLDVIIAGTFLAITTIMFPPLINITTKVLVPKMKVNENNLYDMLAGAGCYIIVTIPFLILMVIGVNYVTKQYPIYFETLKSVPGGLILFAVVLFIADVLQMKIQDRKRAQIKEVSNG